MCHLTVFCVNLTHIDFTVTTELCVAEDVELPSIEICSVYIYVCKICEKFGSCCWLFSWLGFVISSKMA